MITLFSGTCGSGKSLHTARVILGKLLIGHPVICNFDINKQGVRNSENFMYIPSDELEPGKLIAFSKEYFKERKLKEDTITLVIDECQMMFNSRDYNAKGRMEWNNFFQTHRHYGYHIILCAQFDRMLDRQIRCVIEYEFIHRKVSNFGLRGKFLCLLMLSPTLFCCVKMWYPLRERMSAEFFKYHKRYGRLYDTFMDFNA